MAGADGIAAGEVRVGFLEVDNSDGPAQAATLVYESKRGPELLVPYLWDAHDDPAPQFARTAEWFRFQDDTPPPGTMVFADNEGIVTLTGNRATGGSLGARPLGRIRPQVAIYGRPRTFQDEYRVREFASTIDGLEMFAGFQPVNFDTVRDENVSRTTVVLESGQALTWHAQGFEYSIRSNVRWSGKDGKWFHVLDSEPFVRTLRTDGATPHEHLAAQWPIRALLVLAHGTKLAWRSHRLLDDEFPTWMLDGHTEAPGFVTVHLAGTIEQHSWPEPPASDLYWPMVTLNDLGSEGLERWVDLHADEAFERAVQPAVEVINGASSFLEPQLMMLAISLDRFGYLSSGRRSHQPLWRHIEQCLNAADLAWPEIGSNEGIAKAIANVNNDLKHPDRESYPSTDQLVALVRLSRVVVRAQLFHLLKLDRERRESFLAGNDVRNAVRSFTRLDMAVDDNGNFVAGAANRSVAERAEHV